MLELLLICLHSYVHRLTRMLKCLSWIAYKKIAEDDAYWIMIQCLAYALVSHWHVGMLKHIAITLHITTIKSSWTFVAMHTIKTCTTIHDIQLPCSYIQNCTLLILITNQLCNYYSEKCLRFSCVDKWCHGDK